MSTASDGSPTFSRKRLCELAGVERNKHLRWTAGPTPLLGSREPFGINDVVRASMLDELLSVLRPALGTQVWRQIEADVGVAGNRLEAVVELPAGRAKLVRSDDELLAALPRAQHVVVVALHPRVQAALENVAVTRPAPGAVGERPPSVRPLADGA